MKLFTIKGYDVWMNSEGRYAIEKEGKYTQCPFCAYGRLWSMLRFKGI